MAGGVVVIIERAKHFEPGQYPIDPIKLPTCRLRIEVAARQHRWQRVISTGAAGKNVAHLVDLDLTPSFTGPADEHIAALAIHVCQGHTTHAAARCCPDPGHLHQRLPESLAVNTECFHTSPLFYRLPSLPNWVLRTAIGPAILAGQLAVRGTGAQPLPLPEFVNTVGNALQGL